MSDSGPKMWKTVDIKFDGHTKVLFLWESRSDLAPYWPRKNWSAHKIKRSFKSETIRLFLSELASGNGRDTSHSVWINPETADVANESWTLEHRVFLLFGWWFYSRFVERQFWRVSEPIQFRISSRVLFWNVRADLWFEWMIPWLKKSAGLEYWCANWLNWFRFQLLFTKHFSFENFLLASDSTESTSVAPYIWESSCRQQPCGFLSDSMASGKNSNSKTQIEMLQIVYPEVFFIQNAF